MSHFSNEAGQPLTRETFEAAYDELLRQRAGKPIPTTFFRILGPREQQIIAAFDGETIFPPELHAVMMRHGVHDEAPAWTPEEFKLLWKDVQAWAKGKEKP